MKMKRCKRPCKLWRFCPSYKRNGCDYNIFDCDNCDKYKEVKNAKNKKDW